MIEYCTVHTMTWPCKKVLVIEASSEIGIRSLISAASPNVVPMCIVCHLELWQSTRRALYPPRGDRYARDSERDHQLSELCGPDGNTSSEG
jgi:hypothetical protein